LCGSIAGLILGYIAAKIFNNKIGLSTGWKINICLHSLYFFF
jgi:hypothetical protein